MTVGKDGQDDYFFLTFSTETTIPSLEFLAKLAGKSEHFQKHVKKGIVSFQRLIDHFHQPSKDRFQKVVIPNGRDLFSRPEMHFYDNIRCTFHRTDEEGETANQCALQSCFKIGYVLWSVFKTSYHAKGIVEIPFNHIPGELNEEPHEMEFYRHNFYTDTDFESEIASEI